MPRGRDAKLVAVEGKLVSWIQERIAAGHRVTTRMARVRAGRFAEEMDCVHVCKFSSTWLRAFMRRDGLSLRRRTRKKNQAIEDVLEVEARFQASMRRFEGVPPERRFNFDQVPLPLMCCGSSRRTIANRGAKEVWVRQPRDDSDKRQATVHLTLRAGGEAPQPKPILVFRGKGLRISEAERNAWDPRVHVLFQPRAWVDRPTMEAIVGLYADSPAIDKHHKNNLFLCDNLDAHKHAAGAPRGSCPLA